MKFKLLLILNLIFFFTILNYATAYDKILDNFIKNIKTQFDLAEALKDFEYQQDFDEYWKKPNETIIDNGGDCEDFAILSCYALRKIGRKCNVVIMHYADSGHAISVFKEVDGSWSFFDNQYYISVREPTIRDLLNRHYPNWKTAFFIIGNSKFFYKMYKRHKYDENYKKSLSIDK